MPADTTTVPANLAVRAALDVCQVLRHAQARSDKPLTLETLEARTGLEPNLLLWGIRVLEDEGLIDVAAVGADLTVNLRPEPTGSEA